MKPWVGWTLCVLAFVQALVITDLAFSPKVNRFTGEWNGPIEDMPAVWTRVDGRRLVKRQFGVWPMYQDVDDWKAIFNDRGTPFEFSQPATFGAIDGGTNIFTGEKHYNPKVTIKGSDLAKANPWMVIDIPASADKPQ